MERRSDTFDGQGYVSHLRFVSNVIYLKGQQKDRLTETEVTKSEIH